MPLSRRDPTVRGPVTHSIPTMTESTALRRALAGALLAVTACAAPSAWAAPQASPQALRLTPIGSHEQEVFGCWLPCC